MIRGLLLARVAWVPTLAYLGSTLLHLSLLRALMGPHQNWGNTLIERLTAWDGRLFLEVAEHGYPNTFTYGSDGKLTGNNLAFLPLYPFLTRIVHGITGLSYQVSGLVVAHLAFLSTLVIMNALLWPLYGQRIATISVALLAFAQPMGIVFLMSYSESLFTAFAAGALLATYRKHWITAGTLASLAGLTRAVGVAVTIALGYAVLSHLVERRRVMSRPLTGLLLGALGLPLYLLWVGFRVGPINAWFVIQEAGWGTHWDNGRSSLDFVVTAFTGGEGWVMVSTAVLVPIIMSITLSAWRANWLPLVIYGTVVVVMTLGQSNYYHCKMRLLLPTLVVVVPIARALSRMSRLSVVMTLTLAALGCGWYGAYMLTVWHYAI